MGFITMDFYGFLRTSLVLSRSSENNIIDYLTNSARFILFRWISLLKFWQHSFISRHQVSIIWYRSKIYVAESAEDV